jgi:hypothetical protein
MSSDARAYQHAIRSRVIVEIAFGGVLVALSVGLFNVKFGRARTVLICCTSSWVAGFVTYAFLRPRPSKPAAFKVHNPSTPKGTADRLGALPERPIATGSG